MTLRERILQWLVAPEKAATGIGVSMMSNGPQLSAFARDPRKAMKQAQELGLANLYVRAAERVIGDRFSTIPWHLETEAGEELENEAVSRIVERPYIPRPGDPVTSTPQTRSALWRLTSRHLGLCGTAFWYLDQANALNGWPLDIIYINPARVTPAEDKQGNLLDWVLDADLPGHGTPLGLENVLTFRLEPADYGHYGVGLVESAFSRIEMQRLADRHANDTLASGGRLSGVFAPSAQTAGSIPEDQYEQLKRDLRTISEDPNAARRALVLRGPIEYTKTSATPTELDLTAIAELGRDGILDLWGVPLSQLGGNVPGGMNSGETRKYDEASLMQNAVLPRLRAFAETLQYQLLDRLTPNPQLVIEEPTYDDEAPAYDILAKAVNAPLTNAERRAIIGMEPTGNAEFDNAVYLPINLVPAARRTEMVEMPAKASADDEAGRMIPGVDAVRVRMTDSIADGMRDLLERMKAETVERALARYEHLLSHPADVDAVLPEQRWVDDMMEVLRAPAALAAQSTYDATREMLQAQNPAKADIRDLVLARLLTAIGDRIKGIIGTTRTKVQKTIEDGIADGLGAAELGKAIESSAGFGEYRAEMIARTETNRILNLSQLNTYTEFGVERVRAIDGDDDDVCRERNGTVMTTREAELVEDHPNGTLDWAPLAFGIDTRDLAPAKAEWRDTDTTYDHPEFHIAIHNHPPGVEVGPTFIEPPTVQNIVEPTPITVEQAQVVVNPTPVTVNAPDVHVSQPDIHVESPTVNVTHEKAETGEPVMAYVLNWPEPPAVKVERGPDGRVTGARPE